MHIIFFSIPPGVKIVSPVGRHTPTSIGGDIGLGDFVKKIKVNTPKDFNINPEIFDEAAKLLGNFEKVARFVKFANGVSAGLTSSDGLASKIHDMIPMVSQCNTVIIGKPTSGRIKNIAKGPFIETAHKYTSTSMDDYQKHDKRKNLTISTGFNQKNYVFMLEDTYYSIEDYYNLFKIDKLKSKLEHSSSGNERREFMGAVLSTHHKFKFKTNIFQL
jgi:hypothetical protein